MNGQKHEILYPDTSCNMFSVNYNKFQSNFQFECIIKHIKLQFFQVLEPINSQQRQHPLYSQHSPIILVIFWSKSGWTCHSGHFLNLTRLWLENDWVWPDSTGLWLDSDGLHQTSRVWPESRRTTWRSVKYCILTFFNVLSMYIWLSSTSYLHSLMHYPCISD